MQDRRDTRKKGIRARREMTPEERCIASGKISKRVAESDVFRNAHTVFLYCAMPDEVDLSMLTEMAGSSGKRFCYPLTLGEGRMEALLVNERTVWKKGAFGITEPDPDTAETLNPAELDLILCPCSAFDETGGRMGMGGGYYDRFLPECPNAVIAAVAFEAQKVGEIPMGDHDVRMSLVFTEDAVY